MLKETTMKILAAIVVSFLVACGAQEGGNNGSGNDPKETPKVEPQVPETPTLTNDKEDRCEVHGSDLYGCPGFDERFISQIDHEQAIDEAVEEALAEVEEVIDLDHLHNSIMSIQVGDTIATMAPEARDYLLTLAYHYKGVYTSPWTGVTTHWDRYFIVYIGLDYELPCTYRVKLEEGVVTEPPECE